jgi:serine/threonine protein kinase
MGFDMISSYKNIATINEAHNISLVQDLETGKVYVQKVLDIYNYNLYYQLYENPISGTPRIFDFEKNGDRLIIVEEYITGSSVEELLNNSALNSDYIYHYLTQLCDIVGRLHAMNPPIIHRDIKPSNVIITADNQVVLIDFNAAKYYSLEDSSDTILLGTRGYAAPEQYGFGVSSPETDIYAIGALMKDMVNGTDSVLNPIIEKCMQLNPKDRYSSIYELRAVIMSTAINTTSKTAKNGLNNFSYTQNGFNDFSSAKNNFNDFSSENDGFNDFSNKKKAKTESFLPPGFRTGNLSHMIIATLTYLLVFWLSLTLEVKNTTVAGIWLNRIFCLIMLLLVIFFSCDYRGIQGYLPLCNSPKKVVKILGILLWNLVIIFGVITILIIIENIL